MNPEEWWTNVCHYLHALTPVTECADFSSTKIIHNTFKPLIGKDESLPSGFTQKLFQRFSSSDGYELQPHATELLHHLRNRPATRFDRVVVGVITNSDDRVPGILSSLGLRVGP